MFCFQFGPDPMDYYSDEKRISEADVWLVETSRVGRAVVS